MPAKTVPDAALLIMQLDLKIDVLIINLSLPGAGDFINAMHRAHRQVSVIGISEDPPPATSIPGVSATHPKPGSIDLSAKTTWIQHIERVVTEQAAQGMLL